MSAAVSPIESDVLTALRSFIVGLIPSVEVVRGLGNRVPMPPAPFIAITTILQKRLATNVDTYNAEQQQMSQADMQVDVQIDCYGPNSLSWATILAILLRDPYGCDQLSPNCQPLYADEPRMMPLIDAEQQYEERWMLQASLQYNPVVTITQQSATVANVELIEIDEAYPA